MGEKLKVGRIAFHEAGHGVVSRVLAGKPPRLISIIPTVRFGGWCSVAADPDSPLAQLAVHAAGDEAEALQPRELFVAASMKRRTLTPEQALLSPVGMATTAGEMLDGTTLEGGGMLSDWGAVEDLLAQLETAWRRARHLARRILEQHRAQLWRLASELEKHRAMTADEFESVFCSEAV